jgi:hypothetical protein
MLSVFMLSVFMLSVFMLSVLMLIVANKPITLVIVILSVMCQVLLIVVSPCGSGEECKEINKNKKRFQVRSLAPAKDSTLHLNTENESRDS